MVKRLLAGFVTCLMLVSPLTYQANADSVPGEQFSLQPPADQVSSAGVVIEDSQFIKNHSVVLQGFTSANSQRGDIPLTLTDCTDYISPNCGPDKFYNYKAFFGSCETENSHDCVLAVTAKSSDGTVHKAKYVEDFPGKTQYSFVGDPTANLPNSSSSFIVEIATLPHSKGNLYLVTVNIDGSKDFRQNRFSINQFSAGIFAVTIVNGKYVPPHPNSDVKNVLTVGYITNFRLTQDLSNDKNSGCAQASKTRCALAWPLPLDVEFSMTLKLQTKINGWIHGRLNEVSASIGMTADGDQLISVSGKPLQVPSVFQWFHLDSLPTSVKNFYTNDPQFMTQGTRMGWNGRDFNSIIKDYIGYTIHDFPAAIAWYSAIGDKANSLASAWSFRTIESSNLPQQCNLNSNGLTGIVTTNSNMFVAMPPDFNRVDQTLDYKVSSPHYLPDGSEFKGTYNLVMKSEYARCLYGFTKAPVSATISVLSADGTSQIPTTVLGERDGWLFLSANNFTFSSPTLKVKLTQAAEPTPIATPSPTPSATTQAIAETKKVIATKKTITCVKGKTSKKITGLTPKCPSGFKKV